MTPERTRRKAPPRGGGLFGFILLLVVLVVALVIGSGITSGPRTDAQRAAALDSLLRCPQCEDVSVAQSNASSAVAVRHQVAAMVAAGDTDAQIEQALEDRYGPTILLLPPAHGLSSLLWLVPMAGGAVAVVWVGTLFWRRTRELSDERKRQSGGGGGDGDGGDGGGGGDGGPEHAPAGDVVAPV